jgi:hypothetical protein
MNHRFPASDPSPGINTLEQLRQGTTGLTPTEIVEWLREGDRLRLAERAVEWLNKRCYFHDAGTFAVTAQALVASRAGTLDRHRDLEGFLDATLEDTGSMLRQEDERQALKDSVIPEPYEPRFVFLMENLAIRPNELRRAVVAFNALPTGMRHVLHNCWVQGMGFGRYEEEFGVDMMRARDLFIRAVDAISDMIDGAGGTHG